MANSYEKEVTGLLTLYAGREYLTVSKEPAPGAVELSVAPYDLGGRRILLISCSRLKDLLVLSGATVSGSYPSKPVEVLVGESIRGLLQKDPTTIAGRKLKITGYVASSDHLTYSIVGEDVGAGGERFYVSRSQSKEAAFYAPSVELVAQSLFREVLRIIGAVRYLLLFVLGLSCLFQGYNSTIEAEKTFRVFASMSTPKTVLGGTIFLYACLLSLCGAAVGFSLGTFLPGIFSSLTSVVFHLPHLKPLPDPGMGIDLVLGIAASLPSLFAGLFWRYSRIVAA